METLNINIESFKMILSIIGVIAIVLAIFLAYYRLCNFKHKLKHAGVGDNFDIVMMITYIVFAVWVFDALVRYVF